MNSRFHLSSYRIFILLILVLSVGLPNRTEQAATNSQGIVYQEGFENGQAQGWDLEPGWSVIQDGGNNVLGGQGHSWARPNREYSEDYRLSFRIKLVRGAIHLVYRMNDAGRYFIAFNENGSQLHKQYWPDDIRNGLMVKNVNHDLNSWHQVEIRGKTDRLEFYVDANLEWTYSDPQPLESGSFAFETLDNSLAYVDDIIVTMEAGEAQAALPPSSDEMPAVPAANLLWVRTGGPLGGLGYDVRMRPDNLDKMYVTDAFAGVHLSADGGLTWSPSNQGITTRSGESGDGIPVFSLTIDPNNYDVIWIGTQFQRGIFKSTDDGQSWQKMDNGVTEREGITFRGFTIEPGNSDVVYAAGEISSWQWAGKERQGREFDMTRGVVYKTTSGGANWTAVWRGDNLARYIWIDPRNKNVIYVSTGIFDREAANSDSEQGLPGGEGVVKSIDGGQTWANVNSGLNNLYVGSLYMSTQNPDILLAGTGNNQYHAESGVYLTENGGQTWTQTLSGDIITSVEISTSNPSLAYAGSSTWIYRSLDGGHSWQRLANGGEENGWGSTGIRAGFPIDFQVDPRDPERIFANEYGGGNFLSLDGGESWVVASTGYTGAQVRAITVDPLHSGGVIAAARSGIFISYDGGLEWIGIGDPPARVMEWNAVAVNPQDPQHILAANNWMSEILISNGSEVSWSHTNTNIGGNRAGWRVIVFAPSDPQTVYVGSAGYYSAGSFSINMPGKGFLKSIDGGRSWQKINTDLTQDSHVTGLAVATMDPQLVFASTAGKGILSSSDGGGTWDQKNTGLRNLNALSIAVHPLDPLSLLVGLSRGGVFRSADGGENWKASANGMAPESSITSIVFDPTKPDIVYASDLHSGVYRSTDGGKSWQLINNGLRMRSVNALAISSDGQHLYAGTEGEGVYRLDLNGQQPAAAPKPHTAETAQPVSQTPAASETPFSIPIPSLPCLSALLPITMICVGTVTKSRNRKVL